MFSEFITAEQLTILGQIIFIDLVLAGDNAIIIGMIASKFPIEQRKKIIFWGYKWCNYIKNNLNFTNGLLVTNHWFTVNRWSLIDLYCL